MSSGHLEPNWPPRSPHDALLSSPTGRRKIRQYCDRTSPSPSPLKKSSAARIIDQRLPNHGKKDCTDGRDDDDECEDEETLQLQLAAIEAKLKLKRLREKRKCLDSGNGLEGKTRAAGKENFGPASVHIRSADVPVLVRPQQLPDVQMPVSPQRKHIVAEEAKSPGRILLGIDKGLKGRNVSLRRSVGEIPKDADPFRTTLAPGNTPRNSEFVGRTIPLQHHLDQARTFSERIAETRQQDKAQKERANKLRRQRSTGFGVKQEDIDVLNKTAEETTNIVRHRPNPGENGEFSRDKILKAAHGQNGGPLHRSSSSANIRHARAMPSSDIWINPNAPPEISQPPACTPNAAKKRSRSQSPPRKAIDIPSQVAADDTSRSLFEPFSSFHLSKRALPHDFLTRTLTDKHLFLLPDLLGAVKSPDYVLPDIPDPDHVVLAIIASKSSPLNHKGAQRSTNADTTSTNEAAESEQNNNGKYMVLTLTDLKWTVDLFLFSTGYTRFRKLAPGTVIALLNPDIMPPPPGKADTGRFSLKLSSSDDTVLEIGTSRDLGWCKSVRKDGKQCESWIDKRHTEYCEFHVDVVVERTRRGRMEVQGMSAPFAPGGKRGGRTGYFGEKRRGHQSAKGDGLMREGPQYDRGSRSQFFVGPSMPGQSAAQLLDSEGATDRYGSKEDRVRKRLAEREKENEIARRLGEGGNGAGSEYLRLKQGLASTREYADSHSADAVDANSLGLLGNRAKNVHLSPVKKRKASDPHTDRSKKRTRFVTDAGIKEAGRDSFGGEAAVQHGNAGDDEDELEVV